MSSKKPQVKLSIRNMDPVTMYYRDENKGVLSLLLTALNLNKDEDNEDEIMFLDLGDNQERSLFFRRSDLIAVETSPSPSEEVFALVKKNIENIERAKSELGINEGWRQWIWSNLSQGYSKDVVYQALMNHGFAPAAINRELKHSFCAANVDPVLVAQLTGARESPIFLPNANRLNASQAEVYTVDDFLSDDECNLVLKLMETALEPSRVFADEQINEARTSQTCFFRDRDDSQAYISHVEERVCKFMGIHRSYLEGTQGQCYEAGQEYKPHADFFSKGTKEYEENCKEGSPGQRTYTFLIYLKDDFSGGQTRFNNLNMEVQPKRGMALIWNNLYASGEPNPYTQHQALPVEQGIKAILNFWFRERGDGSKMMSKPDAEYIKNYTKEGIAKAEIPPHVYEKVMRYYEANKDNKARITLEEPSESLNKGDDQTPPSEVISLTDEMRSFLHEQLKPVLESWCGETLEPTLVYGIRRYFEGARLTPHHDWCDTHVISAILCVDQSADQEWPLQIDDNYYRRHQVAMKPGDMLLYESARLLHGRPEPLASGFHCNLYVHYRPSNHVLPDRLKSQGSAAYAKQLAAQDPSSS